MRELMIAGGLLSACLGVSACSEPAPAPDVADAPIMMKAGEWTITRKTTGFNTPTVTPAEYQAALKDVSEDKICIAVDAAGTPDADALEHFEIAQIHAF